MAKASPIQKNFNAGEFSPLMYGRVDNDRYVNALQTCLNMVPLVQGGITRRGGTYYVAEVKTSSNFTRLIPFQFSVTQAYQLEFGNQYIRFYKNHGQILNGGSPYEIASPYTSAQLPKVKHTQSADVLYLVHPDHPPRKLQRYADNDWRLDVIEFVDGPYLVANTTAATLMPGATTGLGITIFTGPAKAITNAQNNGSGGIRITSASHGWVTGQKLVITGVTGTTEANGTWVITRVDKNRYDLQASTFVNAYVSGGSAKPSVFVASDIGRLVRIKHASTWGYATIVSFVDSTQVTADIERDFGGTTASMEWRLGLWGETNGYPAAVTFFEDRLFFGGARAYPQRVDGSVSGEYENFAPTNVSGTITNSNAVAFTLNANDVNVIHWLSDDEKGLLIGTAGGEWILRASNQNEALSATNVNAKRSTTYGCADLKPLKAGKATLYVQRAGRKVRELAYLFEVDGFRAPDMTVLSEHILESGVRDLTYEQEPCSLAWLARNDGVVAGLTYDRPQEVIGWHRHIFGGWSDAIGNTPAQIESASTIPAPEGDRDETWYIVRLYVNGVTRRYIVYQKPIWRKGGRQDQVFHVDCGLTLNNTVNATLTPGAGATVVGTTGVTMTAGGSVFVSGDVGRLIHYDWDEWIGDHYEHRKAVVKITGYTSGAVVTGTILSPFPNTGVIAANGWRMTVTTVSGFGHLEGQTIRLWVDGAVHPDKVVTGGQVTLDRPGSYVTGGLGYDSDGMTLRIEAGAADGTAQGKTKRINLMVFRLQDTLGFQYGRNFDNLSTYTFRESSQETNSPVPLFNGDTRVVTWPTGYDNEGYVCWRFPGCGPGTLLAIMPQLNTQDR
jgi:hypothetical protein